jgi:DNA-binding GntR family transcriptional regulator
MEENTIIRAYLEGLASRFAAEKADEDNIRSLQLQIEIMKQRTEKGSLSKMIEANRKFHMLIHETGKNPYLRRMIEVVRSFDTKLRDDSLSDREETKRGLRDHISIFEAIQARDGNLAEDRMRNHILRVLNFVLDKYK